MRLLMAGLMLMIATPAAFALNPAEQRASLLTARVYSRCVSGVNLRTLMPSSIR